MGQWEIQGRIPEKVRKKLETIKRTKVLLEEEP